jgi:predicted CopG family antitoxin
MPIYPYRGITVTEDVYGKLEQVRKKYDLHSIAEAVEYLVEKELKVKEVEA